jgi:hypothetical protein
LIFSTFSLGFVLVLCQRIDFFLFDFFLPKKKSLQPHLIPHPSFHSICIRTIYPLVPSSLPPRPPVVTLELLRSLIKGYGYGYGLNVFFTLDFVIPYYH